jgi:hypothetical protein
MIKRFLFLSFLAFLSCGEADKTEKIQNLLERAKEFSAKSDYNSAIACYNEIISLDSNNAERYDERAQFLGYVSYKDTLNQKLPMLQLNDLNKAIVLNATTKRYIARAEYWKGHNENDKALSDYNFAVANKTAEDKWDPLNDRARFYFYTLKDSSHAFADMKEAMNLAIQDEKFTQSEAQLNANYAEMLMDCRQFEIAEEILVDILDKCRNNNLSNFWVPLDLAQCRIELGDYYGALFQLETYGIVSEYSKILKGHCLVKLGQKEFGMNLIKKYGLHHNLNKPRVGPGDKGELPPRKISKYYLEYFPQSKEPLRDEQIGDDYNWPN